MTLYRWMIVFAICFVGASSVKSASSTLGILTFNVLNEEYYKLDYFPKKYKKIPWKQRKKDIANHLSKSNADIICLQEISRELFSFLTNELKMRGYYTPRNENDGYALFFSLSAIKEKKYEVIDLGFSRFAQKLSFEVNNTEMFLYNTKVAWIDYNKQLKPYLGLNQIKRIFNDPAVVRSILVGDLNCAPNTVIPNYLLSLGFRDVFDIPGFSTATVWANNVPQRVDYVFATKDLKINPISEDRSMFISTVPSDLWPSDHAWLRVQVYPESEAK